VETLRWRISQTPAIVLIAVCAITQFAWAVVWLTNDDLGTALLQAAYCLVWLAVLAWQLSLRRAESRVE
jgi:hypothetical protein